MNRKIDIHYKEKGQRVELMRLSKKVQKYGTGKESIHFLRVFDILPTGG